ncbi:hypothetical protein H6P81_005828 [Aristolochia fimbriata]|uniref:Uncharacterized protein n=1 Tax=Aristolochia fimbriata TaxID=158543 RepID=A0AAV7EWB5_ARIFI|nr:hypothetical protein H6P81_005828 [Aristolochia fimbriata]
MAEGTRAQKQKRCGHVVEGECHGDTLVGKCQMKTRLVEFTPLCSRRRAWIGSSLPWDLLIDGQEESEVLFWWFSEGLCGEKSSFAGKEKSQALVFALLRAGGFRESHGDLL